ncbi:MAG: GYD domain-containing protein [Acidobacteria bacterium]|nr:GYD domain-containing protein [Acidobacteriota bacterium]
MAKFLIQTSYTPEGIKGLRKDKASGRLAAATQAVQSLGGKLESMHFALGADDVVLIVDLPDVSTAAAFSSAVSASGLVRPRTTALLTVAEMDEALSKSPDYRGPGQ